MNMWFCKEVDWLAIFMEGIDVYTALASDHFGIPLDDGASSVFRQPCEVQSSPRKKPTVP
jgi:hypothetical protein